MADTVDSDEEKYANESFENESDNENTEIPEISEPETESESDICAPPTRTNSLFGFTRIRGNYQKSFMPYDTSSDDDDADVVISETIAEINTEPMRMEDAQSPRLSTVRRVSIHDRGKKQKPKTEKKYIREGNARRVVEDNKSTENNEKNIIKEKHFKEDTKEVSEEESEEEEKTEEGQGDACEEDGNGNKDESSYNEEEEEGGSDSDNTKVFEENGTDISTASKTFEPGKSGNDKLKSIQENKEEEAEESASDLNTPSSQKFHKEHANLRGYTTNTVTETETDIDYEPKVELRITSQTPSSFNDDDYAFHLNFIPQTMSNEALRGRGPQRKSWSFTNDRMREIERQNHILLKKILTQKPTYGSNPQKSKSLNKFSLLPATTRVTTAAINRKKQQRQIDLDNQGLKRRIEAISLRRPHL